jgi:hypothetical protein
MFTALLNSLGNAQINSVKQIQVDGSMEFQHYEHFKRLVLKTSEPKLEFIEGFELEWGYHYVITVVEEKFKIRLSDGTESRYVLKEVISKEKIAADHSFQLFLDAHRYYENTSDYDLDAAATFTQVDKNLYRYFDTILIEVPEHLERKFLSILSGEHKQTGTFQNTDRNRIRLVSL